MFESPHGDVAQLVERLHGMQEVESSNLFVSTSRKRPWLDVNGVFCYPLQEVDMGLDPL